MAFQVSGGEKESGVVFGNAYDKYGSSNPVVRWVMRGFESALSDLVDRTAPGDIHEIGCGEGYWTLYWATKGIAARGCDFSEQVIELARENAIQRGLPSSLFQKKSIYDLDSSLDAADLVVCAEVLEHLEDPQAGLEALQKVVRRHLIVSVPREPLWRVLNLARGKYLKDLGNTPGHIQHWSKKKFLKLVSGYFEIVAIRSPLPWTMLLCRPRG